MNILLVDDDALDRELCIDAIKSSGKQFHVIEAENGEQALDHLNSNFAFPNLIILDSNMPVKNGMTTLKEIKSHQVYKTIPVCIMSTSGALFDVTNAYNNGANLFLVKPLDFKQLGNMMMCLVTLFSTYVATSKNSKA